MKIQESVFTLMIQNYGVKLQLQLIVIYYTLNTWCIRNKMKFITDKCKVFI